MKKRKPEGRFTEGAHEDLRTRDSTSVRAQEAKWRGRLTRRTGKRYYEGSKDLLDTAGLNATFGDGIRVFSRSHFQDPRDLFHEAVRCAVDPTQAHGKVTSLKDMTPEKRAEMERLYGEGKK